jgi:putative ABC transport system permease protein
MITLAFRNLLRERVRLAISVGGVAFAVAMIILIRGLFVAYQSRVSDYFGSIQADLWVLESGTADFFHSFSLLPPDVHTKVEAVPGVASVRPYVARLVATQVKGTDAVVYLVGFDPDDPVVGPSELVEGTADIGPSGLIVDEVFARQHDLSVGDHLAIGMQDLTIEGVSRGGDLVMFQYAFATEETAREVLGLQDVDNAELVRLEAGADPHAVRAALDDDARVQVRDPAQLIEVNQRPINAGFLPVVRVLLILAFVVGVAVVGLVIYSSVVERRREYGMLKALGAKPRHLVAVIATQALLAAAAGFVVGFALALAWRAASQRWVPQFITEIRVADLVLVAALTAGMALLAALLPLLRIARIDPAEVFAS